MSLILDLYALFSIIIKMAEYDSFQILVKKIKKKILVSGTLAPFFMEKD